MGGCDCERRLGGLFSPPELWVFERSSLRLLLRGLISISPPEDQFDYRGLRPGSEGSNPIQGFRHIFLGRANVGRCGRADLYQSIHKDS